jgi:hypothetical protein
MTEERVEYRRGDADPPEPPPLTIEELVAQAHANRQGIPYETGEPLLARLPERLRALADLVLSGKMQGGDVAYALAALIDSIENAPGDMDHKLH